MPYYEYEYIVKNLINILKEKKEAEEGASSGETRGDMMKQARQYMPSGFNPNNPSSGMKAPKIPSYSPASFPSIPSSLKI